jgi:hypothetical protein
MRTAIRSLRSTDFDEALGVSVGGCRVSAQSHAQLCVLGGSISCLSTIEFENAFIEARRSTACLSTDIGEISVKLASYSRAQLLDNPTRVALQEE